VFGIVTRRLGIAFELREPAPYLAFVPIVRLAEALQSDRSIVDRPEQGGRPHLLLAHAPAPGGIGAILALELAERSHAFERGHQIEAGADYLRIVARRIEMWMRH